MFLELNNITKTYGQVVANNQISFGLNKGEILAVIGENGAGKSTIMKILYGLEHKDSGEIVLNGKQVDMKNPQVAISHGIGMVQQHFMLFENYTVAENIVYSKETRKGIFFDRKMAENTVRELSKKYGLDIDPTVKVNKCSVGLRQRIEILKVLYQNAEIIIFDEPTAVLVPQEVKELLKTLKSLREMGKSIVIITHKLHEVMEVADRAVILRKGEYVDEKKISETNVEELAFLMVGRKIPTRNVEPKEPRETVLEIKDLRYEKNGKSILNGINMYVKRGEVVGLAGVSGNGQSELIECITGLSHASSGSILLNGQEVKESPVREIRELGCTHIPEDRFLHGCASDATLEETAIMGYYRKSEFSKNGILNIRKKKSFTKELLSKYQVKYGNQGDKSGSLSGGNLQKLIVAREIEHDSDFLIAAEPTRGVDIGAMEFIHDRIIAKRDKGDAVLLVSSELTEILSLSDRVYIIYDGEIRGEVTKESGEVERIGYLMMGGKLNE